MTPTPRTRTAKTHVFAQPQLRSITELCAAAPRPLQLLCNQGISAPDEVRDEVRALTRMQMLRTVAAWRPDYDDFDHPAAIFGRGTLASPGHGPPGRGTLSPSCDRSTLWTDPAWTYSILPGG